MAMQKSNLESHQSHKTRAIPEKKKKKDQGVEGKHWLVTAKEKATPCLCLLLLP